MSPDDETLARWFAAHKKWVWRSGMLAIGDAPIGRSRDDGVAGAWRVCDVYQGMPCTMAHVRFSSRTGLRIAKVVVDNAIPDLGDELTRLGVIAVVRQAWKDPTASVRFMGGDPLSGLWCWETGHGLERRIGSAATELEALRQALEAAP